VDIVAVAVWALVAALALPVAGGALSGIAGLAAQPVAALGGLALCILFLVLDGPEWAAWGALALACLGIVADALGAASLLSADRRGNVGLEGLEELEAGLLGVQLPLFGVAALLSLAMVTDVANWAS
jgi:hypothetical protein